MTYKWTKSGLKLSSATENFNSSYMTEENEIIKFALNKMLLSIENLLLSSHRQREEVGIKKLYNSFFVMF